MPPNEHATRPPDKPPKITQYLEGLHFSLTFSFFIINFYYYSKSIYEGKYQELMNYLFGIKPHQSNLKGVPDIFLS